VVISNGRHSFFTYTLSARRRNSFVRNDRLHRPYILNMVAKSYDYALVMSCLLYLVDGVVICNSSEIDY
jgi:hypothetical protein